MLRSCRRVLWWSSCTQHGLLASRSLSNSSQTQRRSESHGPTGWSRGKPAPGLSCHTIAFTSSFGPTTSTLAALSRCGGGLARQSGWAPRCAPTTRAISFFPMVVLPGSTVAPAGRYHQRWGWRFIENQSNWRASPSFLRSARSMQSSPTTSAQRSGTAADQRGSSHPRGLAKRVCSQNASVSYIQRVHMNATRRSPLPTTSKPEPKWKHAASISDRKSKRSTRMDSRCCRKRLVGSPCSTSERCVG